MLVVVLVAELMNALDGSVVYTALPAIQHDTGASGAAVQWIHAAYALTFAIGLVTGGRLGDLHGRKRLFLLGTGVFTAASLLCGLAGTPAVLIAARFVQGGAAAVMIPQVLATLHVTFDEGSRAKAFSLYGTVMSLGSVAGPVLGGVLTSARRLRPRMAPDLPDQCAHRPGGRAPRPAAPARIPRPRRPAPGPRGHAPGRLGPAADRLPAHRRRGTPVARLELPHDGRGIPDPDGLRGPAAGQDRTGPRPTRRPGVVQAQGVRRGAVRAARLRSAVRGVLPGVDSVHAGRARALPAAGGGRFRGGVAG
ncbi:MFS transporter [Streptomyces mobaraensis]|uniref:MFS transporter n=1 Tax=Streptomyces mobaraensis TaxID=35621 RepID=A0A5N5W699_STRMB|nr:MFS transporter [Streptomyces mobaraensis]